MAPLVFILGGILLFIGGISALFVPIRKLACFPNLRPIYPILLATPPDDMSPALVHALIQNDTKAIGPDQALATLLNLAHRGVIKLIQQPHKKPGLVTSFELALQLPLPRLQPHERVLLDIVFPQHASGQKTTVSLPTFWIAYHRQRKKFEQAVYTDAQALHFFDPTRQRQHRWLKSLSWILLAATIDIFCLYFLFIPYGSDITMVTIPTALAALTCLSLINIYSSTALTDNWWQKRHGWKRFSMQLQMLLSKSRALKGTDDFAQYLPHAANFYIFTSWLYYYPGQRTCPTWFQGEEKWFVPIMEQLLIQVQAPLQSSKYISLPYVPPVIGQGGTNQQYRQNQQYQPPSYTIQQRPPARPTK